MKKKTFREKLMQSDIVKNRWSYLLLLPALIFIIVFAYIPMVGVLIAFEDFDPRGGHVCQQVDGLGKLQILLFEFFLDSGYVKHTVPEHVVHRNGNDRFAVHRGDYVRAEKQGIRENFADADDVAEFRFLGDGGAVLGGVFQFGRGNQ